MGYLYPTCILRPRRGWPRRNFVKMFDTDKTRVIVLPYGGKTMTIMLKSFHLIPGRHGRTDRRTDRIAIGLSISRVSVLTRDKNRPILTKFGTLQQMLNRMTVTWPKSDFFKIQDGGGRHLENRFFGHNSSTDCDCPISAKFCTRKRNGMQCQQRPRDKNSKCLKFKMADGCHLRNRFFDIPQQSIVRFQQIFAIWSRIACQKRSCDINCKFRESKMADGRYFEIVDAPHINEKMSDFDEIMLRRSEFR